MSAPPVDPDQTPEHPQAGLWARRVVVTLFAAVAVLALAGVFGQETSTSAVRSAAADVRVSAPRTVRGGLFFQTRLEVHARTRIAEPRIVLDPGILEGMQVNSIEPAAASETSRDGRVELSYDAVDAGELLRIWMQFEVNPTSAGRHAYGIEVDDGTRRLARVDRTLLVLP
jgi:hypothetical protein